MKNFTRLFLAVATLFAGFACTTDATEDLGVKPNINGNGGGTQIVLSLEQSRTQLGEKADGVYPLYWSTGDKIAINGVVSAALSDNFNGESAALFSFEQTVERPYNIVYPAPSEDAYILTETHKETVKEIDPESGAEVEVEKDVEVAIPLYPVTFPAKQTYAEGTFASGVAPMYGYAEAVAEETTDEGTTDDAVVTEEAAATAIQLKHLSGALRFNIKGSNNEVLSKMTVTSHTDGLAGTFYVRCSTGTLVVKEGSTSNQIEMSFGDGLALKADEATPVYFVVPAGSYGAVTVTLTTTDSKVMVVKFSSYGDKAFKAGTVREFAEFTFAENSTEANESGVFEIYTVDDLQKFAKIAPVFTPRSEAKLMADIDMTGVEWTPIDGFVHTFQGNNKSIKGMSAPLFGTCEAKIYDLTLTDVAIVATNDLRIGSIANNINNGAIVNCSASGTLTYTESAEYGVHIGGLVGRVNGCEFTNNTNNVNITVIGEMVNLNEYILRIGGLAATLENPVGKMEKSTNNGSITITKDIDRISGGGLIGFCDAALNMDDCHNYGEMSLAANVQGASFSTFSGLIGSIDAGFDTANPTFTVTNCTNRGDVTFGEKGGESVVPTVGKSVYYTHISGMFGHTRDVDEDYYDVKVESSSNYGNVEINNIGSVSAVKVGGIFTHPATDVTLTNCHNYGKLGFTRCYYDGASGSAYLGGLIAHIQGGLADSQMATVSLVNCTNEGEVYISALNNPGGVQYFGGIAGYVSGTVHYSLSNVHNKAKLTVDHKAVDDNIYVGSNCGYAAGSELTMIDCGNEGEIVVNATLPETSNNIYIGGIIGHNGSKKNNKFENVVNSGNITTTGASNRFMLAGLVASTGYDLTLDNCSNSGNITLENKQEHDIKHLWFGGLTGVILNLTDNKKITLNGCTNSGDLTVKDTAFTGLLGVGGIAGQLIWSSSNTYYGTVEATDCTNEGDILIENSTAAVEFSVGGIVSATTVGENNDGKTILYNPVQKGNITINHSGTDTSVHMNIGGLVGVFVQGTIAKNSAGTRGSVTGNIRINSSNTSGPQWRCVGGVVGEIRGAGKVSDIDIVASGTNSIGSTLSALGGNTFNGGIVGYCNGATEVSNIINNMPITVSVGEVSNTPAPYVSGLVGYVPAGKAASFSNITNNGAVTLTVGNAPTQAAYLSGGFGRVLSAITATDITNNGAITFEATTALGGNLTLGGMIGVNYTAHGSYTNLTNNGDITVKKGGGSYKGILLGGITGGENAAETATNHYFNCVNNGDITIEKGITSAANIRMGGCFSWIKACYSDKIKNTGDIYMHANTSGNVQILLGGVFGYNPWVNANNCLGENGGYINTGNITVTGGTPGTTNGFATTIGGVGGAIYGNLNNAINTGNITFTGDYGTSSASIGGIVGHGNGRGTIANCKQYGDILVYPEATPTDTKYGDVTGVIVGSTRVATNSSSGVSRTAVVRNCELGGKIATAIVTGEEDADGNATTGPNWKVLSATNYYENIYRGENSWAEGSDYDGCTYISAKPTIAW